MTNANNPDSSTFDDGDEHPTVEDAVQEVANWYSTQIAAERRSPVPDEDRVKTLKAEWEAALADREQLATASPEEAAKVAEVYTARLQMLTKA